MMLCNDGRARSSARPSASVGGIVCFLVIYVPSQCARLAQSGPRQAANVVRLLQNRSARATRSSGRRRRRRVQVRKDDRLVSNEEACKEGQRRAHSSCGHNCASSHENGARLRPSGANRTLVN
jgi:hypothetical protein